MIPATVYVDDTAVQSFRQLHDAKRLAAFYRAFYGTRASVFVLPA